LIGPAVLLLIFGYLRVDSCLQEEKRALAASRDNLDRLYRDASNSLTILERSHRFTMTDLDHHRHELQVSQDEILRLRQLVSSKDSVIKDLRASKRSVAQELEATRLAAKVAVDKCATLKAQCDKAMDKAIRTGRILMRRHGVVVLDDIVADIKATLDASSRPSSSIAPAKDIAK
jgi:chromosome segregation ATPase